MDDTRPKGSLLIPVDFDPFEDARNVGPFPLTEPQAEIWAAAQMGDEASCSFNQCFCLTLQGPLSAESMQTALQQVIDRHEALQVTIDREGCYQEIFSLPRLCLPLIDLSAQSPESRAKGVEHLLAEETSQPFDLTTGPLLRAKLVRESAYLHKLIVTIHHIVCDGWSSAVLFSDLSRIYAADRHGLSAQLPPAGSLRDYVDAGMSDDAKAARAVDEDFWADRFKDAVPVLELPTDQMRPSMRTFNGSRKILRIDGALTNSLKSVGSRNGCTLFVTLLSAVNALLFRLTGQDDIVIGVPMAGQALLGNGHIIAHGVSLVPLRCRANTEASVLDQLESTRQAFLDAQSHQGLTLGTLIRRLDVTRDSSRNSMVAVTFNIDRIGAPFDFGDVAVHSIDTPKRFLNFELSLNVLDSGRDLSLECDYNTDLFRGDTIERWLGHFYRLLEAMVADPQAKLGGLTLLSSAERSQLLVEWNETAVEYPRDATVVSLFEAQAAQSPEATAVVMGNETLSYGELNARANQLARYIKGLGVGPEVLVGLAVERSLEMIVGVLGIMKAGGAYLPLDPSYPVHRLEFMLVDAAPPILLTQQAILSSLPDNSGEMICLDSDWAVIAKESDKNLAVELSATSLAYVIYTSGTTGQPKGALLEHRGLCNVSFEQIARFGVGPGDRVLQFSSLNFDASLFEIVMALLSGATLVMASREDILPGPGLIELLQDQAVTLLTVPPSVLSVLPSAPLPDLRVINVAGEACSAKLVSRWAPDRRFFNLYGPTEATIWTTFNECEITGETPSIGVPIGNAQVYVLDDHRSPVPIGVPGELYIGGDGVARGYLNREELTAERFVEDPFNKDTEARLYRTGDLVRWRSDGTIEFLGREDDQVKIRGFRIELGEVESQLTQHPQVKQAVVLAREDVPGEMRLVAYYTTLEDAAEFESLRAHLEQRLPQYMVPSAFLVLDALPLTPNGKVDRKALPAPEGDAYSHQVYEAPEGEVEIALSELWQELLQVEQVGRHDNFFALGGHSLLAVRLIGRMGQKGLQTDVHALFNTSSLWELAAQCEDSSTTIAVPENLIASDCERITPAMLPLVELEQAQIDRLIEQVPGGASNVQDIYPLAPLQEGILFHHLLHTQRDVYVLHTLQAFDTRERLDRFVSALQMVIARHDILRTGVMWEGLPEPVQVVWREAQLPVEEVTLERGDAADQLRERFHPRRYRLDVRQAPMQRAFIAFDEEQDRWLLLLLTHHLTADHTTLEIIATEIQAYLLGQQQRLTAPVAYRSFVAQARLGISAQEHEQFFSQMLGDIEEPTAPLGLLDVQGDGEGISEACLLVDAAVSRQVRARARAAGVSAASLCHLAWAQVLARLTGREEVVFGTVLFGRLQGGQSVEQGVGLFINTLPLRLSVDENSVEQGLRATHVQLGRLLRHEHTSLALAQRCSAVPAPAPLFTTLMNYRYTQASADGVQQQQQQQAFEGITPIYGEERTNYPLALSVDDLGEDFELTAQASAPIEPHRICTLLHTALAELVAALEHAPQTPTRAIDVLPAAEREQVLVDWNATSVAYPRDETVVSLFESQAAKSPDATAVVMGDESLSYGELNARANQLAHYIKDLGVGPEVLVGLSVERSLEMIVGMLGILKAGGAYVPLDPSYPAQRLEFMLADTATPVLLTQSSLIDSLPATDAEVVRLDADWPSIVEQSDENLSLDIGAKRLAYVIYTSGSTGQPKGVMVEHSALSNLTNWHQRAYAVTSADRATQLAAMGFDACVWEIWPYLTAGASLYLPDEETRTDPTRLWRWLKATGITITFMPTPMAEAALNEEIPEILALRYVLTGGDRLKRGLERSLPFELVNHYGPTENTVVSTCAVVTEDLDRAPPIGRPIANTTAYVLDAERQPVPVGAVGDLYVGGASLARGYLNRDELTAQRFIEDPFSTEPGARLYRTGDLVRWRSDGTIEFLGREDDQVKVRGFRIELGEIEAALRGHPEILDVAVLAREDIPGEKRLVAYVVGNAEGSPEVSNLRAYIKACLPEYMVPAVFVVLDELPLTANGKVDRKNLPAPEWKSNEETYVAPRTPVEETLVEIWAEVLQIDRVGVQDNFFELGGHSLLATQVISRIRTRFEIDVPLSTLFDEPTIEGVAGRLDLETTGSSAPPITKRLVGDECQASFAQQRLWFLDQLEPGSTAYHMPFPMRLKGELDVEALQQAVDALVTRHESLRTSFVTQDGEPVQRIADELAVPVEVESVESEDALSERLEALSGLPFDLSVGPLLRVQVLQLSMDEQVLLLMMHHIISDGWSIGVMFRELTTLYTAYRAGEEPDLPALPVQYADYAVWQRQWLSGDELERQLDYWRGHLEDAPPVLELPTDRVRLPFRSHRGASCERILPGELANKLTILSQAQGSTLFMVMLAAFDVLLSRWSGQQDVVVATPIAGRQRTELEGLIGLFLNALALRTDLSGNPSFTALLGRVREVALGAYAHQDLPFEKLVEELSPVRDPSHNPIYQVMFHLHNEPFESSVSFPELEVQPMELTGADTAKLDLNVHVFESDDGLVASFQYDADLFDAATIEQLADRYQRLLEGVVETPKRRLSEFALLSDDEQAVLERAETLTRPTNAYEPALAPEQAGTVVSRFEAQVAATPNRVAAQTSLWTWSYGELNAQANQVAHALLAATGPEAVRVGMLFSQDVPMLAGLMGALKAGKTYVPLDPSYPQARLEAVMADAGIELILTDPTHRSLAQQLVEPAQVIDVLALEGASSNPEIPVDPDTLVYIIYTSGSTGEPKGVMQTHRNVLHHVGTYIDALRISAEDRLSLLSFYGFDAGVQDIYGALLTGAMLLPMDLRAETQIGEALSLISEAGVSVIHCTPSVYRYLLSDQTDQDLSRIRLVALGGEEARASDLTLFKERFEPGTVFVNALGITESTMALQFFATHDTELSGMGLPIGRAVARTEIELLDETGAPGGVFGEIGIRSAYLTPGYWGRPELTSATFTEDPSGDGQRLYRTGDLARRLADGQLVYMGRADRQVKIRGFRIELGEIEAALARHPAVSESMVIVREDMPGEKRLVAYVVGGAEDDPQSSDLRTYIKELLPDYMVPAAFVVLDELPLTPNGKLDRKNLPAPEWELGRETYVAPRTPVEEALAAIFVGLLPVEQVGIHDNFFELGGHSLLATQLLSRVRGTLDADVPLRRVFESPTVLGIAEALAEASVEPELPPLVRTKESAARAERREQLAQLGKLSDDQVEALLEKLSREGGAK